MSPSSEKRGIGRTNEEVGVARKKQRRPGAQRTERIAPRRRSRLPVIVLTAVIALTMLGMVAAGFLNTSIPSP